MSTHKAGFPSTVDRALLWKELRMQRPVLLAGAAFTLLLPLLVAALLSTESARYGVWDVVRGLPTLLAAMWSLLAVAAGAITFATEAEDGTARFLLSRPVTRLRLWCLKVAAAAATLTVAGALALLVMRVLKALIGPAAVDYVVRSGYSDLTMFTSSAVLGVGLLFFACGVLCSTLISRSLTAAAAAVALGLAAIGMLFTVWAALGLTPQVEPQWPGFELAVLAAVLLVVSVLIVIWPEQLGIGARLGASGRLTIGSAVVLSVAAVGLPVVFAGMTPELDEVSVVPGSVSHNGTALAMAMRTSGGTTQTWLLMTDGSGARMLTGRHTLAPQWSGDDTMVAYYSRRGPFGGEGEVLDLRVTDVFGAMSWTAVRDMPGVRELFFHGSGRGGRVAFVAGPEISVAQLSGFSPRTVPVAGAQLEETTLLGFRDVQKPELLLTTGDLDVATVVLRGDGELLAHELEDGSVRKVQQLQAGSVLPARLRNAAPDATTVRGGEAWVRLHIPVLAVEARGDGTAGARLLRVNADDGEVGTVYEISTAWTDAAGRFELHRCAAVELAPERSWRTDVGPSRRFREPQLLFGDCSADALAEAPAGVVRLVGVRTREMISWPLPPGWSGRIHRIYLDQRQETVLLDIRGETPAEDHALTLDLDGNVRDYPAGWTPMGWTTLDYFLLQREQDGAVTFAVGDARNGEIYDLFPNNELREVLEQRRLEEEARAGDADMATAQR